MTAVAPVKVVHFADPWCWWSWGLEPVLRRLEEVYGDRLEVEYRMGGTFEDLGGWMEEYGVDPSSTVDWIRDSIELTRNPVDPDYLAKTGVRSTYPACRAFEAAARQDREKAHRYFRRLMEAFQIRSEPATEETLLRIGREAGLDVSKLKKEMVSKEVEQAFEGDRHAMHRAHVNFLSLLVVAGEKTESKGDTFTSAPFEELIDRLAPGLPKRVPSNILEYLEKHRDLTPVREVAEVFQIPDEEAESRLRSLEAAGLLLRSEHGDHPFWTLREASLKTLPLEVVRISHVTPHMTAKTAADLTPIITRAVQNLYTDVATSPQRAYHFPLGLEALRFLEYDAALLAKLPRTAVESFAGVGNPFYANAIRAGDTVLDVGSGSGTDVLCASLLVGSAGQVYGLDFTLAMIEKARSNIDRMNAKNVRILEGNATSVPLPDASVDVVTSNGVLNLVPDKASAFREIFRVLRPGGRLQLADIVVQEDVGAVCGLNPQLWADCIGGAAVESDYLSSIRSAGFLEVRVIRRVDYFSKSGSDTTRRLTRTFGAESIVVSARKGS